MGDLAELTGIDVPTGLFIGGEWGGGRDGGTFPVLDPATEESLTDVADGTADDALDAVGAAHAALPAWAATAPRQRAEILRKAFELMEDAGTAIEDVADAVELPVEAVLGLIASGQPRRPRVTL